MVSFDGCEEICGLTWLLKSDFKKGSVGKWGGGKTYSGRHYSDSVNFERLQETVVIKDS